ncbi:MAG: hypothetical protein V7765_09290 [Oleispira sp.]
MKKTLLSSIFIILNLMVVDKALATIIYNELEFELPISHENAIKIFSLDSEYPLRKGDVDNRETLVHKGVSSKVVGITFYTKFGSYKELEEALRFHYSQLEKKYRSNFTPFEFSFFASVDGKYHFMSLEGGASIVLGDVVYNSADNNYVTVSFFQGVSEKEIHTLLNSIY